MVGWRWCRGSGAAPPRISLRCWTVSKVRVPKPDHILAVRGHGVVVVHPDVVRDGGGVDLRDPDPDDEGGPRSRARSRGRGRSSRRRRRSGCPGRGSGSGSPRAARPHARRVRPHRQALGREPNRTELGLFSVMWSEHCSYKSSQIHLKTLPTTGPRVLQGPGENAGAVDIGDGLAAVFKIESHNHPSFIEPYQGAATGRRRDPARHLHDGRAAHRGAELAALRAPRRPEEPPHPRPASCAGIGGYGNAFGCPTVGGEVVFEPCYAQNPLVNAFCLGLVKAERDLQGPRRGRGQHGLLRRRQDGPRRDPRRHHGLGGVRRGQRGEAGPRCRSATRSWRRCCSRPASRR